VRHGERTRRLKQTVNDRISVVLEEAGLASGDFLVSAGSKTVSGRSPSALASTSHLTAIAHD
jgi:hypothetical protein